MKRFEYRLDSLLRVREWQKKQAELREMQTLRVLQAAEADVTHRRTLWRNHAATLPGEIQVGLGVTTLIAMQQRSLGLEQQLAASERRLQGAFSEYREASEKHRKLAVVVEALKKNRAEKLESLKRENAKQEQNVREEGILQRWLNGAIERTTNEERSEPWET